MAGKSTRRPGAGLPSPLTVLYQRAGLPAWPLPRALAGVYGGDLGFRRPCVYANFVASVDGVTALGPEYPSSGSAISGHDPADRFVMGLLRACADVVLIGAGTLRATPGHRWTPVHACPAAAESYAALRRTRGLPADPLLAVVTARGDTARPGLVAGLELLPGRNEPAELLTVRRHGSYLFLRYATRGTPFAPEPAAGSASRSEP